jgi:DNA modification methylase
LDPFSGSATTGKVANDHGRDYIGLDANTEYLDMAVARLQNRAAPSPNDTPDESSVLDLFG